MDRGKMGVHVETLAILTRFSDLLSTSHRADDIPDLLLTWLLENWEQAERGILFLYDESVGDLVVAAAYGYDPVKLAALRLASGEGMAGRAFHTRRGAVYS